MKTFKYYFTADCISFTFVILVNALFNFNSLDTRWTLKGLVQIFVCTTLIELLMYFTDKLNIKTLPVYMLMDIADICAVIYFFGMGLFKLITFSWQNVLITFVIIAVVYFLTFAFMILEDRNAAILINKKLQKLNGDDTK